MPFASLLRRSCPQRGVCATLLACAVLLALTWGLLFERIGYERREAERDVYRKTSNLALAFEQDVVRTLQGLHHSIDFAQHEFEAQGHGVDLHAAFALIPIDRELFTSLSIVDASGRVVVSTGGAPGANMADRDFFAFHAHRPESGLHVGRPVLGRLTGRTAIPVSRRIDEPDGTFGGIALAGVTPSYFTDFYRRIDVGPRGLVQLVGLDGIVRARQAGSETSWGGDLANSTLLQRAALAPTGTLVSSGRVDGITRYMSYRRVEGYPLLVVVGMATEEAMAPYRGRKATYLAAASGATVLLLLFTALLLAMLRRQQLALEEKHRADARFRDLVDNTNDFIWELDAGMRFTYASESLRALLGVAPEKVLGRSPTDFMPEEDRARVLGQSREVVANRRNFAGMEHTLLDAQGNRRVWEVSGVPILGPEGELRGYRGVSRDITERKRAEEQLLRDAHYDRTTGLPNRALCFDRLDQAIAQARRQGRLTALLLLDMDRFKNINDTLGHASGDGVLRAVAARLTECVRSGDTVARVGGDEFAIVLQQLQRADDAAIVAKKILHAVARPIDGQGQEVFATLSLGIAISPPDGEEAQVLVRNADAALRRAKLAGRNIFQFYTREMNTRAADQLALERDLRRALERGEFALHYQPKARIAGDDIVGFEALLRWNRPGKGPVSPAEFVPVLEESGLIREVGAWVIREACRQARAWQDAGLRAVPVAVNVSAKQFNADLVGVVAEALRDAGISPAMLQIEITESDAMLDPTRALDLLQKLRALGVTWAIDDFGTGYSSLGYLKRFQPAELKLDRSFVSGLPDDADDASITRAVISMAHSLGMKVVAEGVETEAQRAFLAYRGCDQMQGYLLSKPLPARECAKYLVTALDGAEAA